MQGKLIGTDEDWAVNQLGDQKVIAASGSIHSYTVVAEKAIYSFTMNGQHTTFTQPSPAILFMTEKHRVQWLRMLNQLQDAQAPADQLELCRVQLIRLQGALSRLRKG